jgi:cardiolipin synthase A/B
MNLFIQPESGAGPLIGAIDQAKKSIEIAIFRFDHEEIYRALERAVDRSVSVHALIADTNHGEGKDLRRLEMSLLPAGIQVSRTDDDLRRHHYKFMIVDRQMMYLFTFNYTHLDMEHSRSFGVAIDDPDAVAEAVKLFNADARRQGYQPAYKHFVVSPLNAREQLVHFIRGAEKQLLIYDPEVSDPDMIHLLRRRAHEGVEIRIIGRVVKPTGDFDPGHLMKMRFHTRAIVRDRREAFLGSQSLREMELDHRRELGLLIHNREVVRSLVATFESDWAGLEPASEDSRKAAPENTKVLKKAVKAIVRDLPLAPIVEEALKKAVGQVPNFEIRRDELRHNLTDVVKEAVEEAVTGMVKKSATAHV